MSSNNENIKRIREPRGYDENSLRLDMAERGSAFSEVLWKDYIQNQLTQLDVIAYPDYHQIAALEATIKKKFGVECFSLVADCGSDALIKLAIEALSDQKDTICALAPSFPMYGVYTKMLGRHFSEISDTNFYFKDNDYILMSLDYILETLQKNRPKLFFFSNPSSPFGGYYTKNQISLISECLDEFGGILILDEAYSEFIDVNENLVFDLEEKQQDNILILRTLSKAVGIAGLRLGFLYGSHHKIEKIRSHQLTYPITGPAISFAKYLFNHYTEVEDYIDGTIKTRKAIIEFFHSKNIHYINSHTNSIHFSLSPTDNIDFNASCKKYNVLIKGAAAATPIKIPNSPETHWIRMSLFADLEKTDWFTSTFN